MAHGVATNVINALIQMKKDDQRPVEPVSANSKKRFLTWAEHKRLCQTLAASIDPERYDSLHPVLRGGVCPAVELSQTLGLPVVWEPRPRSLVVDDICDSGATVAKYQTLGYDVATVHYKERSAPPDYFAEKTLEWIVYPWESSKDDESLVVRLIEFVGDNPNRAGLATTPRRVVEAWRELFRGYNDDYMSVLEERPSIVHDDSSDDVVVNNFEFYSTCERSTLPFFGVVSIGLKAARELVDTMALAKLVDCVSRRFQTQERVCEQIANAIERAWKPQGVCVKATATHARLISEGAGPDDAIVTTIASRGNCELIKRAMD